MTDAKISFRCPGCDETIGFPGTDAGTVQDCPVCGGWVDVPELTRSPNLADPREQDTQRLWADAVRHNEEQDRLFATALRHNEEQERLFAMSCTSHEEWKRQLEQSARYQDQAEEGFRRLASLIARWEGLADRFERVLHRFERNEP